MTDIAEARNSSLFLPEPYDTRNPFSGDLSGSFDSLLARALFEAPHESEFLLNQPDNLQPFLLATLPGLVDWMITDECQLSCPHCYGKHMVDNHVIKPIRDTELEFHEKLDVVDLLGKRGVYAICFSGGEPLISPGFLEVIAALKERGILVVVNSNGLAIGCHDGECMATVFTPEGEERKVPLKDFLENIDQINFSFDFVSPESYRGDFPARVGRVVNAIKDVCRSSGHDREVQLTTCLSRLNIADVGQEVLPVVASIMEEVLLGNLRENAAGISVQPPIWKMNLFRPQKVFGPSRNELLSVTYEEYYSAATELNRDLIAHLQASLSSLLPRPVLEELLSNAVRVNKHVQDASYQYVMIMPNGVLATTCEDPSESYAHIGASDYVLLGNIASPSPWGFRDRMGKAAFNISRKLATLRGQIYEAGAKRTLCGRSYVCS